MPDMWQKLCNWQVDVDIIVAVRLLQGLPRWHEW